jgi:hypothetical protein
MSTISESMDSEIHDDKLHLHKAKCICDNRGYVYNHGVLNTIYLNSVVRISFSIEVSENTLTWSHDAPYVKIIGEELGELLGTVLDINHKNNTNRYPLMPGEIIWFKKENIIEIPLGYTDFDKEIKGFLTAEKLPCTGPLFTTIEEFDSGSESGSNYGSDSSRGSNDSENYSDTSDSDNE